jgi:adenylate cyclase class 2
MANEVETKVLDIDVKELLAKLKSLKAKKVDDVLLKVDWYQAEDTIAGEEKWFLRIRSYNDKKFEVTWKAKSDILGTARRHKEINFNIGDPLKLGDLFEEVGLKKYAHQEKRRISFTYKKWRFDIDFYPDTPAFLEIEGQSESHVKEAMKLLGLSKNRTWADGERKLITNVFGLNWYDMRFKKKALKSLNSLYSKTSLTVSGI